MPNIHSLPDVILSAERLSGSLVPLGTSLWPLIGYDTFRARIHAAMPRYQSGIIFSGRTAAWVWGVQRTPPYPMEYAVDSTNRVAVSSPAPFVKRELTFLDGDLVEREGRLICTPLRTVFDLLQQSDEDVRRDRVAIRLLMLFEGCSREDVLERLSKSPRIPHSKRVRERLSYEPPTSR